MPIRELPKDLGVLASAYQYTLKTEHALIQWYQSVAQKYGKTVAEAEEACRAGLEKALESMEQEYDAATMELFKYRSGIKAFLEGKQDGRE